MMRARYKRICLTAFSAALRCFIVATDFAVAVVQQLHQVAATADHLFPEQTTPLLLA